MALAVSVPYLAVVGPPADSLRYRGEGESHIELTDEQRLTLFRIQAGMVDAAIPLTARAFPVDVVGYLIDLVTAAAP